MNAASAILSPSGLDQLEVHLLSEDELLSISGGSPFAMGCLLFGAGLGVAGLGLVIGVLFYAIMN